MSKAPLPNDEIARLKTLAFYEILDTPPEGAFDRITKIARKLIDVPICLISLVDAERQWFKSRQGLDVSETSRDISFCAHAILSDEVMIVPDALADVRFADNPSVQGEPHIRFYAGAPLIAGGGHRVGTLCVIDQTPRQLTTSQRESLSDLAHLVVDGMKLRLAARKVLQELRANESAMQAMEAGIMFVGSDRRVHVVNDAFCRVWGIAKDTIQNQPPFLELWESIRVAGKCDMPDSEWNAFLESQQRAFFDPSQTRHELHQSNGATLEWKVIPVQGGESLMTFVDVTRRREVEQLKDKAIQKIYEEVSLILL